MLVNKKHLWKTVRFTGIFVFLVIAYFGFLFYYHIIWPDETEQVTFMNGDIAFSGLLVKPEGTAPHPSIVILHGSGRAAGPYDHPAYRVHANAFIRKGVAVLLYDKRGTGNSKGDFAIAGYNDFVQDALAAVQFLRSRSDIDPMRIGLLGSSEGGWLTPEVATLAGDIAFIFNRCGPPLPWDETVLYEIEKDLEVEGLPPDIIQEVLQLRTRVWKYYVTAAVDSTMAIGAEREAIDADLAAIHKRVDYSELRGLPTSLKEYNTELYTRLASDITYDPTPFLRELKVPMLYVFGENDINVPTVKSVAVLEQLKSDPSHDITIKVYPNVGHSLMTWKKVLNGGYVGDYLDLIGSWSKEHSLPN